MTSWLRRLGPYALPQRRGILLILLCTLSLAALDTLKPWPMKLILDHVLPGQPLPAAVSRLSRLPGASGRSGLLAWLTLTTVVLFLAAWLSRMARSYIQAGVGTRMSYALGADLFDRIQRLSLRFHARRPTGDLVQRVINDCTCVRDLVINVAIPVATSLISLSAMFFLMWRLDWEIAVVAILAAPLLALVIKIFAGPMKERRYEQSAQEGRMMGLAEQTLTSLPLVQAFGREPYQDARFQDLTEQTGNAYLRTIRAQLRFQLSTNAVIAIGTTVTLGIGGLHALEGKLSVGGLTVLLSYVASLYAPLESLGWLAAGFASAAGRARRVLEVLDLEPEVRDAPGAVTIRPRPGDAGMHVRFEDVLFGYEPGAPVLQGISFEARPGEKVAIVGSTGAGKSTLAALLLRSYDPDGGRVTVEGHDIRGVTIASLRSQIAIVLQDPLLLPLSIAENIAYGRPAAGRGEIIEAAKAASAHDFIAALPEGYDTVVGERGATLSGGERQRIAIARALLKDAPILILDEPTSSLDAETEHSLLDTLERLTQGRTALVIAHRLSTVLHADRILVLENGHIVESGAHHELIAAGGAYQRLYGLSQESSASV